MKQQQKKQQIAAGDAAEARAIKNYATMIRIVDALSIENPIQQPGLIDECAQVFGWKL